MGQFRNTITSENKELQPHSNLQTLQTKLQNQIKDLKDIPPGVHSLLLKAVSSLFTWENLKDIELVLMLRQLLYKHQSTPPDTAMLQVVQQCSQQKGLGRLLDTINQLYVDKQLAGDRGDSQGQQAQQLYAELQQFLALDYFEHTFFPLQEIINQTQHLRIQRLRMSLYSFRIMRNRMILNILGTTEPENTSIHESNNYDI